uniref:Uncharacterized protein n=2 Tax=Physcomitrium patens TaxID=3218 RepID=A0A7I4BAI9_PHYPA
MNPSQALVYNTTSRTQGSIFLYDSCRDSYSSVSCDDNSHEKVKRPDPYTCREGLFFFLSPPTHPHCLSRLVPSPHSDAEYSLTFTACSQFSLADFCASLTALKTYPLWLPSAKVRKCSHVAVDLNCRCAFSAVTRILELPRLGCYFVVLLLSDVLTIHLFFLVSGHFSDHSSSISETNILSIYFFL